MYISVRRYSIDPDSVDEVIRRVNVGFVPIITGAPGFKAYYVVNAGGGALASISVFEDQAGAEESNRLAADWVEENLEPFVHGPPEITAGEASIHAVGEPEGWRARD